MLGEEQTHLSNLSVACHAFIIHNMLPLMPAIDVYGVYYVEDGVGCADKMHIACVEGFG